LPEFDKRPIKKPDGPTGIPGEKGSRSAVRQKPLVRHRENLAVSVLHGLIPWKGDSKADIIRKIIFLASLALIIWSAILITNFYVLRPARLRNEQMRILEIRNNYAGEEFFDVPAWQLSGSGGAEGEVVTVIGEYMDWYNLNNDFVGYLEIYPFIQYPVYQAENNEFYLNHNSEKRPTANGTVYADYEGIFTPTERPHNTIIYGHNLMTKDLFQPLTMYRPNHVSGVDSFEFLKTNSTITFDTLYARGDYKIFAVFQSNVRPAQGEVFRYWDNIYFDSKTHFDSFVADILDRSLYYTNVDLQYGDELLLLSTCDFSIFANGSDSSVRLVIAARRVRENERPGFTQEETDAFIDNRGTDENDFLKRKMFEEYYRVRVPAGWAGRNWDLNYIKDFEVQ